MSSPLTLSTNPLEYSSMDYTFLRQEGIRLLERLVGQAWTDFNVHDPGITILEQVCYAITDLAYRTDYDIKDLLTDANGNSYRSLYSPAEILTINPVTLTDLRKLIIDVAGVKNAWFEPVDSVEPELLYDPSEDTLYLKTDAPQPPDREAVLLRGLYQVLIETDPNSSFHPADILPEINRRLHAYRNLGEDFLSPTILPGQSIVTTASIEVDAVEDPDQLLAQIYHTLANFISPHVHFYTLAEMFAQGKRIDEIMNGPVLQHGFINDADLEGLDRKVGLRTSDFIQEIMDIEGVVAVNAISVSDGEQTQEWYLTLDSASTPFLDIDKSLFDPNGPTIQLTRAGIAVESNPQRVKELISSLEEAAQDQPLPDSQRDVKLPAGRDRQVGQYFSIQHQFPAAYGVGTLGLSESAPALRKAQAKQLKAYLMFFDQLLANYFAQLANAKELFSFYAQQPDTYFSQIIDDDSLGLAAIRGSDKAGHASRVQAITESTVTSPTGSSSTSERKNRILNHLLARFAEQFTDYSLLAYAHLAEDDLIDDKCTFLQDYQQIGASRGTGFDYTRPFWDTQNVSGLARRVSKKLGIPGYQSRNLAGVDAGDEGGFHILEHILLRPCQADSAQWTQAVDGLNWQASAFMAQPEREDPYSHQISFIFPNWITRFSGSGFIDLIEKTVREETPAHIRVYVHWLDQTDMLAFESAQKDWLASVIAGQLWSSANVDLSNENNHATYVKLRDARDRMIGLLELGVPYPLRDLSLDYTDIVAYNHPTEIHILGGQAGVLYQLCDEDGNPVTAADGTGFETKLDASQSGDGVFLPTPVIQRDITFTILAARDDTNLGVHLETYLNQSVSIRAGIDTSLQVAFTPADGQIVSGTQITVNYNDKVTATVSKSQEGISYELVTTDSSGKQVILCNPEKGNKGDIPLVSTNGFMEDTPIQILAYRTDSPSISALLDASLSILVRPDTSLTVNVTPNIVDYNAAATLSLVKPQSSADYHLYKRELVASDYLSEQASDSLVVQTDEDRSIYIQPPEKVTDWDAPDGFVLVDTFKDANGTLSVSTGNLPEDTLFIVQATKTENKESLQLHQAVAVLARPNPACAVGVEQDAVASGATGMLTVNGTQKGVYYQLRLDADNTLVNPPGYDVADRGINTTRLEVDFVVGSPGDAVLLLPTGAITQATTFNVLAAKILTGVSIELTGKATISVSASQTTGS